MGLAESISNSMNPGRRSDLQMQLERLQTMDWQLTDNRKTLSSNVGGADQVDSDGGDLNDRDESTDPIEEFLRDIEGEDCDENDDNDKSVKQHR